MTLHYSELSTGFSAPDADLADLPHPSSVYAAGVKRLLDLAIVLLAAPIVVPLILLLAASVWLRDGAAPFYSQKRVGRGGHAFTMWKLRSMVPDAEARLQHHLASNPGARSEWEAKQKLSCDPRITTLGRVLRKSSLDELPQLWNVVTGEMSLVGPRPMMLSQTALYPGQAYYKLRPGITGLWQISDRNDCSFSGRAVFDLTYYNSLSLRTDLRILLCTIGVVLRGTGC